jgi:hypothetical protein
MERGITRSRAQIRTMQAWFGDGTSRADEYSSIVDVFSGRAFL